MNQPSPTDASAREVVAQRRPSGATPSRRAVLGTAAWSAPLAIAASSAPALASSSTRLTDRIAIIGSGYGGAVAALRLGQAGKSVDLIEMGKDWTTDPGSFNKLTNPDGNSQWFLDRTDMPFAYLSGMDVVNRAIPRRAGVLGIEYFSGIKVYKGHGLGGGSLVNGGMAVTPRRSFFSQVLPQVDAAEMYSTYFPRANDALGVTAPPMDLVLESAWYQFTRVGVQQAKKAGIGHAMVPNVYDFEYMRREVVERETRSALAQEVIFGNNHGKKDLTKTYLATARRQSGVKVIPMTEVTAITQEADGTFTLAMKTIAFDGTVVSQSTARYGRVIMAAGSVGTAKLLMAAKATGAIRNLPAATGKRWGPNGNVMTSRRHRGIATGARQSGIPVAGITTWDDSPASVFAEVAPLPTGLEMETSLYLAITNNPNEAQYQRNAATGALELTWTPAMAAPGVSAMTNVMNRMNAVDGGTVRTDLFEGQKAYADFLTYHPLGGMVLGEATDLSGTAAGMTITETATPIGSRKGSEFAFTISQPLAAGASVTLPLRYFVKPPMINVAFQLFVRASVPNAAMSGGVALSERLGRVNAINTFNA